MRFFVCFLVLWCFSCSFDYNPNGYNVPSEFKTMKPDFDRGQILKTNYNNELYISIEKNLNDRVKKSSMFGPGPMRISLRYKYDMLYKSYDGFNSGDEQTSKINGNIYWSRKFYSKSDGPDVYYIYGGIYKEKPEYYHEVLITGKKENEENHLKLIENFLEGIE